MKKHVANIVTSIRILCGGLMLFFPAFSVQFYILYLLGGFSDMVDGTIARKTNSSGKFGAMLDTIADGAFMAASLMKLLPAIDIPKWLWIWIALIGVIKISNTAWGFIRRKRWISQHTIMNKAAGLLLFLLPLTMKIIDLKYSCAAVCAVAMFAAVQEGYFVQKGREFL